jgi:sulfonate transport system ATP-binding protein
MMGVRAGGIQHDLPVDVSRPRDRRDARLAVLKNDVLTALQAAHVI